MNPAWFPISSLPRTYLHTNFDALKINQPKLVASLEAHINRTDILFCSISAGIYECKYVTASNEYTVHDTHSIQNVIKSRATAIQKMFAEDAWLVRLYGVGNGLVLPPIVDYLERRHRGEPKGLLILEKDPGLLLAGLCLNDFTRCLHSGRLLFAVGADFADMAIQLSEEHHLETLSVEQMPIAYGYEITDPTRKSEYEAAEKQYQIHYREHRNSYLEMIRQANLTWSTPSRSIRKVWTQISDDRAAGAILRGLSEGFGELGLESKALSFQDRLFTRYYRCAYDFTAFVPDALLGVNHSSRYIAAFAGDVPIPRLIWFVDHPANTIEIPFHPHDLPFAVSPTFLSEIERRGGKPLGVVPVASRSAITPPPKKPQWKHDVCYVGSVVDSTPILQILPPEIRNWIQQIVRAQISYPMRPLPSLLSDFPCPAPWYPSLLECLQSHHPKAGFMSENQLLAYFLYTEANTQRRIQFLTSLRDYPHLGIYGPPAWERLLPDDSLRRCYRGPVTNAEQLADLYRTCKVNLSLNSLQGFGFVISRVFEVPAAGGFLITEWVPGLETFFNAGIEMFWFTALRELRELINRALMDDEMRRTTIAQAQVRILKDHTYRMRAKTVLEWLSAQKT